MSDEPVRVMMWSTPRSGSTALAKCMSAIDGVEIWFELFVICGMTVDAYTRLTGNDLPATYEGEEGAYDIATGEISRFVGTKLVPERTAYANIKRDLEQTTSKYVFAKDICISMANEVSRRYIPTGYRHAFLIRHPAIVYTSYRKAVYKQLLDCGDLNGEECGPEEFDCERDNHQIPTSTFFPVQHSLWKHIRQSGIDPEPVVLDIDDLLANPTEVLPKFCRAVGLPYLDSLLTWDSSIDVVDTWRAAGDTYCRDIVTFFERAMNSSCFLPPKKPLPRDQLYADVIRLSDAAMPFYEELRQHKI